MHTLLFIKGACIVNEERRIVGTGSGSLPNPFGNDPWAVLVQGTDSTGRKHGELDMRYTTPLILEL